MDEVREPQDEATEPELDGAELTEQMARGLVEVRRVGGGHERMECGGVLLGWLGSVEGAGEVEGLVRIAR